MLDLAIIGSGPAALTAAIYASRANLSVKVFERNLIGGALPEIAHIDNFPGFSGTGQELADAMRQQVENLGVEIVYDEITSFPAARAVLVATGSEPRPLDFTPSAPVSYCALCDAPLYQDKNILVIGGGNSAVGESLLLAKVAKQVTLMSHSALKAEPHRVEQLRSLKNVQIIENTEPNPQNTAGYDGIFVYIGTRPAASFIDQSFRDPLGYIQTAPNSHRVTENIFAAGDVRAGTTKQAITAAADGAAAAIEIIDFLRN